MESSERERALSRVRRDVIRRAAEERDRRRMRTVRCVRNRHTGKRTVCVGRRAEEPERVVVENVKISYATPCNWRDALGVARRVLVDTGFRRVRLRRQNGEDAYESDFSLMWLNKNDLDGKWRTKWRAYTKIGWPLINYARLREYQKVNHFPGTEILDNKAHMALLLQKMERRFPKIYGGAGRVHPRSFVMPDDLETLKKILADNSTETKWWLLKPPHEGQGHGILLKTESDLRRMIVESRDALAPYVVQEYVMNPHLIDGLKYDLRVFVLVTSWEPLVAYLFKDGVVKFCTTPYRTCSDSDLQDPYMHLANNSLNKHNESYDGTKHRRTLRQVLDTIHSQTGVKPSRVFSSLCELVAKTLVSGASHVRYTMRKAGVPTRGPCFELFGFDVILDAKLRPWLCEVNFNPCYGSGKDKECVNEVFSNMIEDMWHIVGIEVGRKEDVKEDAKRVYSSKVDEAEMLMRSLRDEFARASEPGRGFARVFPPTDRDFARSIYSCVESASCLLPLRPVEKVAPSESTKPESA